MIDENKPRDLLSLKQVAEMLGVEKRKRVVFINKNFINHGAIVRLVKRFKGGSVIDGLFGLYHYARRVDSRSIKFKSTYEAMQVLDWPRQRYGDFDGVLKAIHRRAFVVKQWYSKGMGHRERRGVGISREKRRIGIGRVRRGPGRGFRITFTDEFWDANDTAVSGYCAAVPLVGMAKLKTAAEKLMLMHVCAFSGPNWGIETWMKKIGLKYEYRKRAIQKLEVVLTTVDLAYDPSRQYTLDAEVVGDRLLIVKLRKDWNDRYVPIGELKPEPTMDELMEKVQNCGWTS